MGEKRGKEEKKIKSDFRICKASPQIKRREKERKKIYQPLLTTKNP